MRLLIGLLFICSALFSCIGGVSDSKSRLDEYYEQRQKSFDILTLIDTLIGSGNSWSILPQLRQIDWSDHDIQQPDLIYNTPYSREGTVYITMDSLFTDFKSDQRDIPVKWKVRISGARTMYFALTIENGQVSETFDGFARFFKKKKVLVKKISYRCYPEATDCILTNMLIKINSRKYTVVEENQFTLTGGPAMDLTCYIVSGWSENLESMPRSKKPKKLEVVEVYE